MRYAVCLCTLLSWTLTAAAQTAQVGAQIERQAESKLRLDYLHYRPAEWEKELVEEHENQPENQGGLLYLYLSNVSEEPVSLRYWRMNDNDESYWRLSHFVAWDRLYKDTLAPGEQTVLEINGVTKDFGPGQPFEFSFIDSSWKPVLWAKADLIEDPIQVSYIRLK